MTTDHRVLAYRPPRIAMALLLLATLMHYAVPLGLHRSLPLAAAITGLAGFMAMLHAWWLFKAADTDICPTGRTTVLLTRDIYSLTRNPMYLGITLMLLALALFTGTLFFYLAALVYLAIMDRHFCPYEEDKLRHRFPQRYPEYERNVRRWI